MGKFEMLKLRDGRLHVFLQPRCLNYYYRYFTDGKYITRTTKTSNLALAKSTAENAYDSFRLTAPHKQSHSFDAAERGLLTALNVENNIHETNEGKTSPSRLQSYRVKLNVLRKFFGSMTIEEINKTKKIEEYVQWRREVYKTRVHHTVVSTKTLRRDFDVLRAILKYAKREEWIATITDFPKLKATPRAGSWLSAHEMRSVFIYCRAWVNQAATEEERRERSYVELYMKWLVFTGMRVDEALQVRFEDVVIRKAKQTSRSEMDLYVTIEGGKLSYLKPPTTMLALPDAIQVFESLKFLRLHFQPNDFLFPVNPSNAIRQVLDGAGLLLDSKGQRRTAKSFRHTYIMERLMSGVDTFKLASNCRTSVKMIEQHYGSHLNSMMNRDELLKKHITYRLER